MNKKLTESLYHKYPKIFRQKDLDCQQTAMCWGFECDDGWFWLLDILCGTIQRYIDYNKKPQVEAVQVKEKYGGLRFYVDSIDDLVDGMIWLAEHMSYKICETCGSQKDVATGKDGYIRTLCKECRKKIRSLSL